jgi:hypothetical protein
MESALIAALLANAGLAAKVGDRIKWDVLTQGSAFPAIRLHLISAADDYTMDGRVGFIGHLVQMDVFAGASADRKATVRALIAALDTLTSPPLQAVIEGRDNSFDAPGLGPSAAGSSNLFRASLDVRVWAPDF